MLFVKSLAFGFRLVGLELWLVHFPSGQYWASCLTSLFLLEMIPDWSLWALNDNEHMHVK